MTSYPYPVSAFPNGKFAPSGLHAAVVADTGITTALVAVTGENATSCAFLFEADLSGSEETALDAIVAAHTGVIYDIKFHATSKLVDDAIDITGTTEWQVLGGVVTNIEFFVHDLTMARGRIVGSAKTEGTGATLQLVEVSGTTETVVASFDLPDTSGEWQPIKFSTSSPGSGDLTFRLEGKLGGATSAALRFTSSSLLELVPSR